MSDKSQNRAVAVLNILFGSVGYVVLRFILKLARVKVLSSLLTPAMYGTITVVTVTISAITMVSSLGSIEYLMRHLPGRDEEYQYGVLRTVTVAFGGLACALALVGVALVMIWRPEKLELSTSGIVGAGLLLVLMALVHQRVFFLLAQGRYSVTRFFQLAYGDAWFIGLVYLALCPLLMTWTTSTAIWAWAAWAGMILLLSLKWMPLSKQVSARAERGTLRRIVAFGAPLLPMILGEWLFKTIDQWVVLWATDAATVAVYAIAVNVAMVGFVVGTPILDILITEFNKRRNRVKDLDRDELYKDSILRVLLTMMMRHTAALSIPIMAALCFLGRPLVLLISNERFIDAVHIMPWASLMPWLFMTNLVLARVMLATDRSRYVGAVHLVAAVVALCVNIVLVPLLGAKGAAIGNSSALAALSIALALRLKLWRWLSSRDLMFWRLCLLVIASFLTMWAISNCPGSLGGVAGLGLAGLVCGICILVLGLISWKDLRTIVGHTLAPSDAQEGDRSVSDDLASPEATDMQDMPSVTVVVVGYGKPDYSLECIGSLQKSSYPNLRVVYVDNGSSEEDFETIRSSFHDVTILRFEANVGVGNGFNGGIAYSIDHGADYVLMLNNDTKADPDMISRMVESAQAGSRVGIVVPKTFYYDRPDVIWSAGSRHRRFPPAIVHRNTDGPDDGRFDNSTELEFSSFCGALFSSVMLKDTGLLDPVYHIFQEDYDLCARAARLGYRIVFCPSAHLWHKVTEAREEGRARKPEYWKIYGRGHAIFRRKHRDLGLLTGFINSAYILFRIIAEGHFRAVGPYLEGVREGRAVELRPEPTWNSPAVSPKICDEPAVDDS